MSNENLLKVSMAMCAFLSSAPCKADNGGLTIENGCSSSLNIKQTNASCSPDQFATTGRTDFTLIRSFPYGNDDIYCNYGIYERNSNKFLISASFNRSTYQIRVTCKRKTQGCTCTD
jgi:hypothetical protein